MAQRCSWRLLVQTLRGHRSWPGVNQAVGPTAGWAPGGAQRVGCGFDLFGLATLPAESGTTRRRGGRAGQIARSADRKSTVHAPVQPFMAHTPHGMDVTTLVVLPGAPTKPAGVPGGCAGAPARSPTRMSIRPHAWGLATITAAICTGPEAHPRAERGAGSQAWLAASRCARARRVRHPPKRQAESGFCNACAAGWQAQKLKG